MTEAPRPCDLLIRDALVLTMDGAGRILSDGAVAVTGRDITAVGANAEVAARFRSECVSSG